VAFKYRESVLNELARHGVQPGPETPPDLVHEFVNDLYRCEIRRLRGAMRSGLIPKNEYARHVEELRSRYPVLSLPLRFWTVE
jgi:hypothetical protein